MNLGEEELREAFKFFKVTLNGNKAVTFFKIQKVQRKEGSMMITPTKFSEVPILNSWNQMLVCTMQIFKCSVDLDHQSTLACKTSFNTVTIWPSTLEWYHYFTSFIGTVFIFT